MQFCRPIYLVLAKHSLQTFPLLTVTYDGSLRFFYVGFTVSDLSLYSASVGQIWLPNSLCDQLVVWYWPIANNEHSELRPWPATAVGDCMGANSSVRGAAVS
jgi:hypothetical protein